MALKSTIFKVDLQIADMDRSYYADHALTIARHPSENDERMMARVLAFALFADAQLAFANGMTTNDEADLWRRDLTGDIELWIDVGQPDEKLLRKASHRSREVVLLSFGRTAETWWSQNRRELEKLANLQVLYLKPEFSQALAGLVERTMRLQCTVQDGQVWLGHEKQTVQLELQVWKRAESSAR
ncbi:YaeQ family protein [Aquabacterium sp. A7-Y]|uniref:YaeQ family protein n=1 Tax=Aquabacterium sp. A7-Y TaxID=1349605 RepID=UPI00223CDECB|nr:YaeQ family protein [Aquabacterium sp. A7-Y]MCW7537096.1 YaeQ family protein [Aquabacterium sp. A7-Y]